MADPIREYEGARFSPECQLDVHGEGPRVARDRALRWIQSRAHEHPGQELLIIVDRGRAAGRRPSPVAMEIHALLDDLTGKLISRWRPFAPGSIMLRIADLPRMERQKDPEHPLPPDDGRTRETAGAARPSPLTDIPPELLTLARTAAGLRILREGLTTRVEELVLREVWVEAQLRAMESGSSFAEGISSVLDEEREINSRLEE